MMLDSWSQEDNPLHWLPSLNIQAIQPTRDEGSRISMEVGHLKLTLALLLAMEGIGVGVFWRWSSPNSSNRRGRRVPMYSERSRRGTRKIRKAHETLGGRWAWRNMRRPEPVCAIKARPKVPSKIIHLQSLQTGLKRFQTTLLTRG